MRITSNESSLAFPQRVDSELAGLAMAVGVGTDSAPTEAEYQVFEKLRKQADDSIARRAGIQNTDLAAFPRMMAGQNIQAIVVPPSESVGAAGGILDEINKVEQLNTFCPTRASASIKGTLLACIPCRNCSGMGSDPTANKNPFNERLDDKSAAAAAL